MSDRLAAAEAALKAGRGAEAIEHLVAAVEADPARSVQVYRVLITQLYYAGRFAQGELWADKALQRFPRDFELWNLRGVLLRKLGRYPEAVAAFDQAIRIDPRNIAPQGNRGNVLLDMGDGARAEQVFAKLARAQPRNAEYQRQLGRALLKQGKEEPALMRLRQAVTLKKDFADAWLDLCSFYNERNRGEEAAAMLDKALAANPTDARLLEAKAIILRRAGRIGESIAYLEALLPQHADAAWLHYQLGGSYSDTDRERGNGFFRRAVELEPRKTDYRLALIESLERTRTGDEGANIEEAYQLAKGVVADQVEPFTPSNLKVLSEVFVRVCDFDALEALGDFRTLGRAWAESGKHTALLKQIPQVRTLEDRYELIEQHRIWARQVEAIAAAGPIRQPGPRAPDGKIRLGLMSSDLRNHPVGYFALPLFDHIDPRFELYCYSFYTGKEDGMQAHMTRRANAFRWWPEISVKDAAQRIADDQLDILIELGGSTHMNKLEVMAFRPAAKQASWLGYPHSAGLSTIDFLVVDPYVMPETPDLILEQPMMLRNAWYPLSVAFREALEVVAEPPVARNGFVTFGTANNPQKYSREVIGAWARVMQAAPESRFLFIRPEGTSGSFREHLRGAFAAAGVAAERIDFEAVRGAHMPHYNRIDISLDTFPQTGGTTTCESLWMGAPCVTLVGPSLYERLSYSVLMNLQLGELCARSLDDYVAIAARLAGDPARIAELRAGLRARMKASPLGRTDEWARDFYAAVASAAVGEPALV